MLMAMEATRERLTALAEALEASIEATEAAEIISARLKTVKLVGVTVLVVAWQIANFGVMTRMRGKGDKNLR